jgi:hypothetical protein
MAVLLLRLLLVLMRRAGPCGVTPAVLLLVLLVVALL